MVIITNLKMPFVSGSMMAKEIKNSVKNKNKIVNIMLMTSDHFSIEDSESNLFDNILTSPLSKDNIQEI